MIPKDAEFHALSEYIIASIIIFCLWPNNAKKLRKSRKKKIFNRFHSDISFIVFKNFFSK